MHRPSSPPRLRCVLAVLLATFTPSTLRAAGDDDDLWQPGRATSAALSGEVKPRDGRDDDGVHGRFDGDLFVGLGLGAELGAGARAGGLARVLFFQSVGLHAGYAQSPSGDPELEGIGFAGLELRPLFLPRFALDLEHAGPFLDLTLDSLSLGAGVCFADERDSDSSTSLELSAGLGLPLFANASGPWLEARGSLRPGLDADAGQLFLLLSWYESIESRLVR